jgi:hypothetical protein
MALTVLEHGYVVPVSTNQVIEDGVVAFEDTRIIYVGPSDKFDRRKYQYHQCSRKSDSAGAREYAHTSSRRVHEGPDGGCSRQR